MLGVERWGMIFFFPDKPAKMSQDLGICCARSCCFQGSSGRGTEVTALGGGHCPAMAITPNQCVEPAGCLSWLCLFFF